MKDKICDISFYKLTTLPIEKASPKLIEKIYYSKQNLLVIAESPKLMKSIDDVLWVYSTKHFIPHATMEDAHPNEQPVYITTLPENPNNAKIVMGLGIVDLNDFIAEKYIYMFDGNKQDCLEFARDKWKRYKSSNHNLNFWQQTINGSWEKAQ